MAHHCIVVSCSEGSAEVSGSQNSPVEREVVVVGWEERKREVVVPSEHEM